jgi:uncharacterized protein YqjF (DUF2071 family)
MSRDAPPPLLAASARPGLPLPYIYAKITLRRSADEIVFRSRRRNGASRPPVFEVSYRPNGPERRASADPLTEWMVERYRLFTTDRFERVWSADIHHPEWSLQPAEVELSENTMPAAHRLTLSEQFATAHYANYMEVLVWSPALESPPVTQRPAPSTNVI